MKPALHLDSRIAKNMQDIEELKLKVATLEQKLESVTVALINYAKGTIRDMEGR